VLVGVPFDTSFYKEYLRKEAIISRHYGRVYMAFNTQVEEHEKNCHGIIDNNMDDIPILDIISSTNRYLPAAAAVRKKPGL
jgi:hypothetical protein